MIAPADGVFCKCANNYGDIELMNVNETVAFRMCSTISLAQRIPYLVMQKPSVCFTGLRSRL